MNCGSWRPLFFYLIAPPRAHEYGLGSCRSQNLFLQARLSHNPSHECQTISALRRHLMLKPALAGPLRHTPGEIHLAASDFPASVSQFNDDAHGSGADDAPLTFGNI